MALPFISAPGRWYTAYGQSGWSCPYGIQVTYGNGIPPYTIFFTNATIPNPTNSSIGPVTTMGSWGPSNADPGMNYLTVDNLPSMIGDVYHIALQDAEGNWAYSLPVVLENASASGGSLSACTGPEPITAGNGDNSSDGTTGGGGLSVAAIFGVICASMTGSLLLGLILGYIVDKTCAYKNRKAARARRNQIDVRAVKEQAAVVVEMGRLERELPIPEETEFDDLDDMAKVPFPADGEQGGGCLERREAEADLGLPEYHI